ncbi:hypothetical protein [Spirosoma koreense]
MRTVLRLLCIIWALAFSCSPKSDPLPADRWAEGCIQLAPYEGAYRLSGMCCSYVSIPEIKLDPNRTFVSKGTFSTFTGAGFADFPATVSGQLSADGTTLTISYYVNSFQTTYTLRAGQAAVACLCGCD